MRGLSDFFDWEKFAQGKEFCVKSCLEWTEPDETKRTSPNQEARDLPKRHLGTKVRCMITEDKTEYKPRDDGKSITNFGEQIDFKIAKDIIISAQTKVIPKVMKLSIYGEFANNLSIVCSDIEQVQEKSSIPLSKINQ